MVEGWRPRSWAQLGQQQRSRSGFSTLDSARAASALERVVLSLYNQQWLLPSISGLTFPEETPSALCSHLFRQPWEGVKIGHERGTV